MSTLAPEPVADATPSLEPVTPAAPAPTPTPEAQPPASRRIRAVDALRGFDMFWILGAATLVRGLEQMEQTPFTQLLATQLQHVTWEGFRFYDLIFPLFLFLVGVSMVFSLDRTLEQRGAGAAVWQIIRRSVLLFVCGVFYSGGLSHKWPDVGLGGVLQRISECYFCASIIYCACRSRLKVIGYISGALLIGYWAAVTFVPFPDLRLEKGTVESVAARAGSTDPAAIAAAVPERVRGVYEEGRNLTNYVDFRWLPGKKAQLYYINEGLLSTIPAIAICLFGALAGRLIKRTDVPEQRKVLWMLAGGAAAVAVGWLWSFQFPLTKRIWTSSFILVASGCAAGLLAVFYQLIEVWKRDRWCEPFVWIGMNPITLYLFANVFSFRTVAERLVGGDVQAYFDSRLTGLGTCVISLTSLTLVFLLARFLYKHRIFLRV
jgi:predicted acyltransferase